MAKAKTKSRAKKEKTFRVAIEFTKHMVCTFPLTPVGLQDATDFINEAEGEDGAIGVDVTVEVE